MVGLEVSKYRLYYGKCRSYHECHSVYTTERSLFYEDLDKLIDESENTLAHWGQKYQESKAWGYDCYNETKHIKLQLLRDILLKYRMQLQHGVKPCLDDRRIQLAIEETNKLVILGCCKTASSTLKVDPSGREEWERVNPYCVAREKWEALAYKICGDIKIKVKSTTTACDISYMITSKEVDCSLGYAIESHKTNCKITFDVTEEEWSKKVKNTSYKDGKKLSRCGISFDHIVSMEKCGITTSYNEVQKCPQMTYEGKTVVLADLDTDKEFSAENACKYINQITL